MGAAERRQASSKMAAELLKLGFYHGRRPHAPHANSGGLTMVNRPGSSKYQRMQAAKRGER